MIQTKITFVKKLEREKAVQMMAMIQLPSYLLSGNVDIANRRTQIEGNKFLLSNRPNELGLLTYSLHGAESFLSS